MDTSEIQDKLLLLCLNNLENGGRGINNIIEKALVNPLAREIFDQAIGSGERLKLTDLAEDDGRYRIVTERVTK